MTKRRLVPIDVILGTPTNEMRVDSIRPGDWIYEIKFDGYRCIAVKRGPEITLFSRKRNVLNDQFPNVVDALRLIDGDFVLDGEIVALNRQGRPSFQLLQNARSRPLSAYFYIFDLLNQDGEALHRETIARRRERLSELLPDSVDPLRLSSLVQASVGQILEEVRKLGLEGVVGKRNGSAYEAGERSGAWIKLRTNREQEFVIGGYIPGAHGFDALLVGVHENNKLNFVAKVKNGFVPLKRDEIFPKLKKLGTPKCPFFNLPEKKASRWGESLTVDSGEKPVLALKRICKSRTQTVNQILVKESRQKRRDAIENFASTGRLQAEFLPKSSTDRSEQES